MNQMVKLQDAQEYVQKINFIENPNFDEIESTIKKAREALSIEKFDVGKDLYFDGYQTGGWELAIKLKLKINGVEMESFVPVLFKTKKGWMRPSMAGFNFENFLLAEYSRAKNLNSVNAVELIVKH